MKPTPRSSKSHKTRMSPVEEDTDSSSEDNSDKQLVVSKGADFILQQIVSFNYTTQPRAMSETYGANHNIHLPHPWMMQHAFVTACRIRDQELPKEVQRAYHAGVDLNDVQTSAQLTEAAQKGEVVVENCYFDDFLTAEYYRGALRPDKHTADATVPLTTAAQKAHVQLLVKAFNNTHNCDDNAQMIRPFSEKRHDPKLVEVLCWGTLKACIMRANSDEPLLTAYEPSKSRNSHGINTFAERFDELVKSMTRSKTICKHLFDPPYVNVFVDDPVRAVRRVEANRDLNRQKGQIMGRGKQILQDEVQASGDTPQPRSRKRRAAAVEIRDSSADDTTPTRRSLVVKMPVRSTPAFDSVTRRTALVGEDSPDSPLQPSPFEAFTSPITLVKQEDLSPRRIPSAYAAAPSGLGYGPRSMMVPTSTFGGFDPFQSFGYGNEGPSSYGSYNTTPYGYNQFNTTPYGTNQFNTTQYGTNQFNTTAYGTNQFNAGTGTHDFYGADQNRQRQAQYAAHQPGFAYTPMYNRTAASAPSTPADSGFASGSVPSNTETTPTTPSFRGFAIRQNVTPAYEGDEEHDEAEHLDEEGEGFTCG